MRVFEVFTPDGRKVRHLSETREGLAARLEAGYAIGAEVYGADEHGAGGYATATNGKSLMAVLLEAHGDELLAWLASKGYEPHWGGMRDSAGDAETTAAR
jgi:hypothetical protein